MIRIVMGKAYSQDLRERVMAAVDAGKGAYAAASFFTNGGNGDAMEELIFRSKR